VSVVEFAKGGGGVKMKAGAKGAQPGIVGAVVNAITGNGMGGGFNGTVSGKRGFQAGNKYGALHGGKGTTAVQSASRKHRSAKTLASKALGRHASAQASSGKSIPLPPSARQAIRDSAVAARELQAAKATAAQARSVAGKTDRAVASGRAVELTPQAKAAHVASEAAKPPAKTMSPAMATRVAASVKDATHVQAQRAKQHLDDLHAGASEGKHTADQIHARVHEIAKGASKDALFAAAKEHGHDLKGIKTKTALVEHLKAHAVKSIKPVVEKPDPTKPAKTTDLSPTEKVGVQERMHARSASSLPLDKFADRVTKAAHATPTGGFGDEKTMISHVKAHLDKTDPAFRAMSDADFKAKLLEAHKGGHLELGRADMVGSMNHHDVKASATHRDSDTYHFIRHEPAAKQQSRSQAEHDTTKPAPETPKSPHHAAIDKLMAATGAKSHEELATHLKALASNKDLLKAAGVKVERKAAKAKPPHEPNPEKAAPELTHRTDAAVQGLRKFMGETTGLKAQAVKDHVAKLSHLDSKELDAVTHHFLGAKTGTTKAEKLGAIQKKLENYLTSKNRVAEINADAAKQKGTGDGLHVVHSTAKPGDHATTAGTRAEAIPAKAPIMKTPNEHKASEAARRLTRLKEEAALGKHDEASISGHVDRITKGLSSKELHSATIQAGIKHHYKTKADIVAHTKEHVGYQAQSATKPTGSIKATSSHSEAASRFEKMKEETGFHKEQRENGHMSGFDRMFKKEADARGETYRTPREIHAERAIHVGKENLRTNDSSPKSPEEASRHILDAYSRISDGPNTRTYIADLRLATPHLTRKEFDEGALHAATRGGASLYKFDDPHEHTPRDHSDGWINPAGDARHVMYAGGRSS
jgi:hypothetical protein